MPGGGGIRLARNVSAGAVALIAAWSSYSHMVHVALGCGERREVAYALPFSVDGMLVVATVVMVDDKRHAHRARPVARLAFIAGVLASVAANIAAAHPSLGARTVDAWPALALLLVVEMLARPPACAAAEVPPATATRGQPPAEVPALTRREPWPAELPRPELRLTAARRHPAADGHRQPQVGDRVEQPPQRVDTQPTSPPADDVPSSPGGAHVPPVRPARHVASPRRRPTAVTRQLAQRIIAADPDLPRAEVAARLGVSTRRLREVLATSA
jgi:hypothetical protein